MERERERERERESSRHKSTLGFAIVISIFRLYIKVLQVIVNEVECRSCTRFFAPALQDEFIQLGRTSWGLR